MDHVGRWTVNGSVTSVLVSLTAVITMADGSIQMVPLGSASAHPKAFRNGRVGYHLEVKGDDPTVEGTQTDRSYRLSANVFIRESVDIESPLFVHPKEVDDG